MSDRENPEKGDEEAKETDTRTESTSMEETEENATQRHGLGESSEYPVRIGVEDCYYYMKKGRCGYGLSCRFNHPPLPQRDQMRHDMVQPSPYPVRPQLPERSQMRHGMVQPSTYPGAGDCIQYLQTGQCSYGLKCRFNHPPSPRDIGAIDCRQYLQTGQCSYGPKCRYNHPPSPFFQKGDCKNGSGCKFTHSMSGDGAEAEPMRQDTSWGKKRHAAKSSSRPWKRERQAHDLEERKQKKRRVENLRIDPNVQSGEGGSQTEQRLEKIKAETEFAFKKMADALDNQQEVQRSGSNETESRSNEETKGQTLDMRPSGSGTRSVEKAVVRYDRDTRFRDANREATPDRDPIAHAIYWEKKVQELRVRNAEMKQRRANETIQKQRLRNAEMQQRRANKTESISIEETKGETVDMKPSGPWEKAVVRYDRDTRFWEDKMQQQRLGDVEMQQRRANETESRSIEEPEGETVDTRPSGSGEKVGQTRPSGSRRWSPVVRYNRDTRSWEENREYLESSGRENEAVQIRDQNETYIQQRQRDDEMQQRRSRETESIFFQQQKNREYECSGSRMNEAGPIRDPRILENLRDFGMQQRRRHETEWRFQKQQNRAEAPDLGYKRRRFEQEQYPTRPRIKKGVCHFYLKKGWCGFGSDCVFKHPTPSWRFDERRYETEVPENMARTVYGRESGSTWRFDEERKSGYGEAQENNIWWQRREAPENVREQRDSTAGWLSYDERRINPATREILMRPARRMEQRDREREVRNEGAHNSESSPQLGTEREESDGI
ncbi:unnamed protein product [Brassica napus]|nr:unnamed protein product [Brassica napus]